MRLLRSDSLVLRNGERKRTLVYSKTHAICLARAQLNLARDDFLAIYLKRPFRNVRHAVAIVCDGEG